MLDFSDLNGPTKTHLYSVYKTLLLTILSSIGGIYLHLQCGIGQNYYFLSSCTFGIMYFIYSLKNTAQNYSSRFNLLMLLGLIEGMSISPVINMALNVDPKIIFVALIATSATFLSFSLCALLMERRSMLYFSGTILGCLVGHLIVQVINMLFLRSYFIYHAQLFLGLLLFSALIMFNTQNIIHRFEMGEEDVIRHALSLFLDFVNLFLRILIILIDKKKKKENKM